MEALSKIDLGVVILQTAVALGAILTAAVFFRIIQMSIRSFLVKRKDK
jgi:hypothetical protein